MPTLNHLSDRPGESLIGSHTEHQVRMVTHHSIGTYIDSEALVKHKQALFYPVSPVFERSTAVNVLTTKKGTANTAGNTVVVGGIIQTDEVFSGSRH
jgi:hypothetical protein